jgi:hypothetical protein
MKHRRQRFASHYLLELGRPLNSDTALSTCDSRDARRVCLLFSYVCTVYSFTSIAAWPRRLRMWSVRSVMHRQVEKNGPLVGLTRTGTRVASNSARPMATILVSGKLRHSNTTHRLFAAGAPSWKDMPASDRLRHRPQNRLALERIPKWWCGDKSGCCISRLSSACPPA